MLRIQTEPANGKSTDFFISLISSLRLADIIYYILSVLFLSQLLPRYLNIALSHFFQSPYEDITITLAAVLTIVLLTMLISPNVFLALPVKNVRKRLSKLLIARELMAFRLCMICSLSAITSIFTFAFLCVLDIGDIPLTCKTILLFVIIGILVLQAFALIPLFIIKTSRRARIIERKMVFYWNAQYDCIIRLYIGRNPMSK